MKIAELYTEITTKGLGAVNEDLGVLRASLKEAGIGLKDISKYSAIAFAGIAAGTGLAVRSSAAQEAAESDLSAALETTGQDAARYTKELSAAATAIQQVTIIGDETTMSVMSLGINMGVSADQIEGATKQAIGLSKAYGIDLSTSMKMIALARQNDFTLLQRYIPQLRTTEDLTKKMSIMNVSAANGFAQEQAAAKTFSGQLSQLNNAFGEAMESLGNAFLPTLKSFAEILNAIIPPLGGFIGNHKTLTIAVVSAAAALTGLLASLYPLLAITKTLIIVWPALSVALSSSGEAAGVLLPKIAAVASTMWTFLWPALAAVGVAIAGYKLGEWISEWSGLDGAIRRAGEALGLFESEMTDQEAKQKTESGLASRGISAGTMTGTNAWRAKQLGMTVESFIEKQRSPEGKKQIELQEKMLEENKKQNASLQKIADKEAAALVGA